MKHIPQNLLGLEMQERQIRDQSLIAIRSDEDLLVHVTLIEAVMDHLDYHAVLPPGDDTDMETVQLLGARVFNDLAAAYGQTLRGYYQIGAMILRDVMEVVYLLGYFEREPAKIKEWRESDDDTRYRVFSPKKVRKFLDSYDGFKEGKRGAAYKMFCEYAAHPTWAGFRLMGPSGEGKKRTIGSFFDQPLMKAVLEETAQLAAQAGNNYALFFGHVHNLPALETEIRRLDVTADWAERFLGRERKPGDLDELKAMLVSLKAEG